MLAVAMMLTEFEEAPVRQMLGAAPLAAAMAVARLEMGRERSACRGHADPPAPDAKALAEETSELG